jgi:8-oxo-dGTP diphosphatase
MSGIDAASSGIWELDDLEVVAKEFIERLEHYGKMKIVPADRPRLGVSMVTFSHKAKLCPKCKGTGITVWDPNGYHEQESCSDCNGDGWLRLVLMGKRKNAYGAGTWQFPGGSLEYGEEPIGCAIRELKEETNLTLTNPMDLGWCNTIDPKTRTQFIDVVISCFGEGKVKVMEPNKCEGWEWVPLKDSINKKPLFLPLQQLLKKFYFKS